MHVLGGGTKMRCDKNESLGGIGFSLLLIVVVTVFVTPMG